MDKNMQLIHDGLKKLAQNIADFHEQVSDESAKDARIAELEAIVEKLPVTADGVVVCNDEQNLYSRDNDLTYCWNGGADKMAETSWIDSYGNYEWEQPISSLYSTAEAADAPRKYGA